MAPKQENKPPLMMRLDTLEFQMARLSKNEKLTRALQTTLTTVIEMMNGLVDELGGQEMAERVQVRIDAKRAEARREDAKRSFEFLQQLIDSKQVEEVEVAGPNTILVGTESTPDGAIANEKLAHNFEGFNQDVREELDGKKAGYQVVRNEKVLFALEKVWKMAPVKPAKLTELAQAAVTEVPVEGGEVSAAEVVPVDETGKPNPDGYTAPAPTEEQQNTTPAVAE